MHSSPAIRKHQLADQLIFGLHDSGTLLASCRTAEDMGKVRLTD